MKARAPGKVVLSGAYSVLYGAPAVVAAVDRYVVSDASLPASFVTPEVRIAVGAEAPPHFDASALRDQGRKLGLGSSAAIVVASLAALARKPLLVATLSPTLSDSDSENFAGDPLDDPEVRGRIFTTALRAHQAAQGGGSGIDVAASCFGGVLIAERNSEQERLELEPVELPGSLVLEVWASGTPASTSDLLGQVRTLERNRPELFSALIADQAQAARDAADALRKADAARFVSALQDQGRALAALGHSARAPIVTDAVKALDELAQAEAGVVLPSGAGGGDIALYAGLSPPSHALLSAAKTHGHHPLALRIGARGVHSMP